MEMRFRIFKNMFKQGFEGIWRNRGMGLASVTSISAVLLILGIILILILSINNLVVETKTKFDSIQIYLEDDIKIGQIDSIENALKRNKKINAYEFESDQEALDNMKEDWGEESYLLDGLEMDNPLPNSFIVKLNDIEYADEVVAEMENFDGVEGVPYYKDIIDKLMGIANYIRIGGIIIIAILIFVSVFIISNTIKLTVASRKREINIMKYVGATNGYIRGPFIIEGVLFGLIAAIISVTIINFGYEYLFSITNDMLYVALSVHLVPPAAVFADIAIIFTAIGVGIGALGSIFSLRKYLNV